MRSFTCIMHIGAMRFRRILFSGRSAMIFILMGIYCFSMIQPIADFARDAGERVTPYAPPFMINEHLCQLFLMIGAFALFAGAPYKDDLYSYTLARAGKGKMLAGNFVGMLGIAFLYVAFLFLAMSLPFLGNMTTEGKWGKIWTTLAAYPPTDYGMMFYVDDSIRAFYTPLQAMALEFLLETGCVAFLGMCVYLGNQFTNRPVGLWLAGGFVMLDVTTYNLFPDWVNKFSPLALARLSTYIRSYYMPMNGSHFYGFCFYGAGIIAMLALIRAIEGLRKNLIS